MMETYFQDQLIENEHEYKHELNQYQMAISKVKSVQANGDWKNEYGTFYKFEYVMEDGVVVNASHKKNEPIAIGTEVEYEITKPEYNSGTVKIHNPDFVPQSRGKEEKTFKADPAKQASIEKQTALKEANLFHATHGFNQVNPRPDDRSEHQKVCDTADIFLNWLTK